MVDNSSVVYQCCLQWFLVCNSYNCFGLLDLSAGNFIILAKHFKPFMQGTILDSNTWLGEEYIINLEHKGSVSGLEIYIHWSKYRGSKNNGTVYGILSDPSCYAGNHQFSTDHRGLRNHCVYLYIKGLRHMVAKKYAL